MNRVLVVLGVLVLLGAGAVILWRSEARREGVDPTSRDPSSSAAQVDGAAPATVPGTTTAQAQPPTEPQSQPQRRPTDGRESFTRRGRVVDPTGQPVTGLPVGVVNRPVALGGPMSDTGNFVARSVTDAEGRFSLDVLAASARSGPLWVGPLYGPDVPPLLGQGQWVTFDPALADLELEVRVVPGASIEGRVHVDAVPALRTDEVRVMAIGQRTGHGAHTRIDASGRFVLRLLYDDTYLVVASASSAVSPVALDVRTGTQDLELTLLPVGAVRVEVEGGKPAGLRIECSRIGGEPEELARMGLSGRSPEFLLPGAYSIAVFTQTQYGFASVESIGTREAPVVVPVQLEPAALVDIKNEADTARIVVVENAGRIVRAQSVTLAGRMLLSVPPGAMIVHEHLLDGTLVASHPVSLGPNASLEIVLAAPPR